MTKWTQERIDKAKATRERNRRSWEDYHARVDAIQAPYLKAEENRKRQLSKVEALAADERGDANTRKVALAMAEKLRTPLPEPRLPYELPRTLEELDEHKRKWDEIKRKEREAKRKKERTL